MRKGPQRRGREEKGGGREVSVKGGGREERKKGLFSHFRGERSRCLFCPPLRGKGNGVRRRQHGCGRMWEEEAVGRKRA